MDADTPSAAWHPAKRPNSSADEQPFSIAPKTGTSDSPNEASQPSLVTNLALKEESPETTTAVASTEHIPSAEDAAVQSPNHAGELDHLEHDEESGAALWDMETPATNHDATSITPHHEESVNASPERAPTEQASKHLSTMSFARTVSHEMSFNDDEDAEWNLQRSETDPFGFMPETDRTNSFPVVPQLQDSIAEQYSHPLPSTQAEEILQESECENAHDDPTAPEPRVVGQPEDARVNEHGAQEKLFQNTVGGDFVGMEEDASDARYEEGLPLIPQQHSPETNGDVKQTGADPTDLFSQDETGDAGDDFFAHMGESSRTAVESSLDHILQRKSTTMVIDNNVDMEPLSPTEEFNSRLQDIPSSSVNGDSVHSPEGGAKITNGTEDLDAKWAAAFGDDDDDGFLLDATTESKELNPADIFGSDDEGFLDEEEEPTPLEPSQTQTPQPYTNGARYAPESVQQQPYAASNPYAPAPLASQTPAAQQQPPYVHSNTAPPTIGFGVPPPKPNVPKAQSFVNKSKGGYQSPYDLPMEVVKPKKRASAQPLPRVNAGLSAPPTTLPLKSATGYAQPPPSVGSVSSSSPPSSSHSNQPPSHGALKGTQLKSKASFFEDLPMTSRPRPSSRQSAHPSPTRPSVHTPPQGPPMNTPSINPAVAPLPAQSNLSPPTQAAGVVGLVAPERVSPYASLQSDAPSRPLPPSTSSSRYSPAPAHPPGINGTGVASASASRYSPAPPNSRSSSGSYSAVPPPMLAHQPRTSSPLAHFEVSHGKSDNKLGSPVNGDSVPLMRTSSSQYEHRVTRVPSLPPTQEVEEEQSLDVPEMSTKALGIIPPEPRYSPTRARHTPPPLGIPPSNPLSPPKRSLSNYAPRPGPNVPSKEINFVPPPRSQTQSPGSVHSNRGLTKSMDSAPRPSSAHSPTSPRSFPGVQSIVPTIRARGMSHTLNLVPPTDGRELDPLQRWRGAPSVAWGIGGLFVSTFPKDVPRYGISSTSPRSSEVPPLEERLSKFPGPLKGKSKKKEVIAWLTTGIEGLERILPNVSFQQHVSHEDKRATERVLLWKILRILVENDGVLEGNPAVEKAVRDVISPGVESVTSELSSEISTGAGLTRMATTASAVQADAGDSTATESIRRYLLLGDREKAVWMAVDKRLWGHAILISGSMPNPELYKQVAREFIKKEVNHAGRGNESLASLYSVLSGNFEDAVDELVPAHARAGFRLMSPTASTSATSQDVLAGLDKWCETLGLILSNRRQGDGEALRSLGNLLSGYGRAEAAHICYIFSRHFSIFGGLDDPNVNFVLVGADHRRQADQFAKETEALQLSEVYEYGLSLVPGSNVAQSCPHLAAYKLQHAMVLAEHGFRDKALQYCEAIWSAITSQTKKSPYFNPILESAMDDLMKRLKQAAGEESSSWITKPKMDQVSSNMWSRFSKFVAGPDDGTENGAAGEGSTEVGPFARIAGGTPTVSRSPSVSNFEVYGSSPSMPMNKASSTYAPAAAYPTTSSYEPIGGTYTPAARSSMERTSGELPRGSYDLGRRGSDIHSTAANPYAPVSISSSLPKNNYQPTAQITPDASPYMPISEIQPQSFIPERSPNVGYPGYQPFGGDQGSEGVGATIRSDSGFNSGYQPSYGSYEPPSMNSFEPPATGEDTSGGYEPPSYQPSGFEPPSYEPGPMDDDESENKPKPQSFMDDDDDDIPGLRPKEKSKAEKDRENEEMFKRVAEEEAKRAAEAKASKKSGWGLGSWFGGGKKEAAEIPNKPIKAKLGEASSFVYDPELKRWVNKKSGAENAPAKTATPPPPRASSTPPTSTTSAPPVGMMTPPPPRPIPTPMTLSKAISQESLNAPGGAPLMARSVSGQSNASLPPRPATSLSNASSIEDLLGAAGPRKGPKKTRKSGRYVDVMAK
ncbi:hypothetical protein RRF57_006578 [Xylaria bambusicola]|uniref:Protein transport protein sec16 n=1 Tax=Xylaria bambusicola TaxID=326684 RepID=A0AAN7Z995_9PEZI